MSANQATYPVRVMGRLLGVSASGFYAWLKRPPSARALADIAITAKIHAIHRRSDGTYGAPSIHAELADDHQIFVGCKRVARLMRLAKLKGLQAPRYVVTTVSDPTADRALDKVQRQFSADGPDRLWVADITYIPTWSGFLYLAVVLDVWSRRIVGWSMENHLKTDLVLAALDMALAQRRPEAVIHHSDRGTQGGFQWSLQHLDIGGVVWDDHKVGLQNGQDGHRCTRPAGRASISGKPSRRFGCALPQERRVQKRHCRVACRSHWARVGFARLAGFRRSA